MCVPAIAAVPLITAALGAAGSVVQYQEGQANSKAAANAQEETNRRALETAELQKEASLQNSQQQATQLSKEVEERQKVAMRERSAIRAASAEASLGGNSPLRSFLASDISLGEDLATLGEQGSFMRSNTNMEVTSSSQQAKNRMVSVVKPQGFTFGTGLNIANGTLQGAKTGRGLYNSFKTS